MEVGPSEAEPYWIAFLRSLARRGCQARDQSDSHEGLEKAAAAWSPIGPGLPSCSRSVSKPSRRRFAVRASTGR